MIHISKLWVTLILLLGFQGVKAFAADDESSENSPINKLFALSCKSNERATGCTAPFRQCEIGIRFNPNDPFNEVDVIDTCRLSAKFKRCPDFSWEKCCATNCYIRNGKKFDGIGECIEGCGLSPASNVFWPHLNSDQN